ncbi:MAG TPA: hypothetical protein VGN63_04350 [Flavisolibacter sp.]|jgi:hypothetical protein|nr:hypothetical protein [Flavisolibacter sp.]
MKTGFFFLLLLAGCTSGKQDASTPAAEPADTGLYSVQLPSTTLSLRQWDSTVNLMHTLGKPLEEKTWRPGKNSDTHAGAFIKRLRFPGLKLQLYSPPQNGRQFWVQEIILTDSTYRTSRSVTLGDEWQKVQQAYPSLQEFPGENENMYYVADVGYEKSIEMEFAGNRLIRLRMYYMMP